MWVHTRPYRTPQDSCLWILLLIREYSRAQKKRTLMESSCRLKPQRQTCSFPCREVSAVSATAHKKKNKFCICGTIIHAHCKNNRYFSELKKSRIQIWRMFMEYSAAVAARSVVCEAWRAGRVVVEVAVFTGCVMYVCVRTGLSSRALLFALYHCSTVYIFWRRQASGIRGCIRTPAILSFKSG